MILFNEKGEKMWLTFRLVLAFKIKHQSLIHKNWKLNLTKIDILFIGIVKHGFNPNSWKTETGG